MQARRLKTREQFQAVLACAPLARTEHFVMHRLLLDTSGTTPGPVPVRVAGFPGAELWLGAMVPKRWARRAVTRNLIKRQIYNVAQHNVTALPLAAYLVRLRCGFDRLQFRSAASEALRTVVRGELEHLFAKALRPVKAAA